MLKIFNKFWSPSTEQNKEAILHALKEIIVVPEDKSTFPSVKVLEIGSGNGQHITFFANNLSKEIYWQPSDNDRKMFGSICAYMLEDKVENVAPPIYINVAENYEDWKPINELGHVSKLKPILRFEPNSLDFIFNSNMIHISSFDCTKGLFRNSGKLLKNHGCLILYGPFRQHGFLSPESNIRFDIMLRMSDPTWGVRDIHSQLMPLGKENGLRLTHMFDMPVNNKLLVWMKDV